MPTCPKCDRYNSRVTYFPKHKPLKMLCASKVTEAVENVSIEKVWQCRWCGKMIGDEADAGKGEAR